ncbi:MAG: hypothetical protein ACYC9Y_14690 [Candidatus Methylomirabilia bacterium]
MTESFYGIGAKPGGKESNMSLTKEKVIELIRGLPDDITVDDIMEELYFKFQVDEGLAQLDRGEGILHADVEKRMSKWLSQ